jgi:hypothetical protein
MYRFGERKQGHQRLYISLLVLVGIIAGAALISPHFLRSDTHISAPPKPIISSVKPMGSQLTQVQEPLFSVSLPVDWAKRANKDIPAPTYSWVGTAKDDVARWINIYVDAIPTTLAVNRMLPVAGNGAGLSLLANVSDNCTTFTGANDSKQISLPAKWQGVTFLCDTGNYIRDVVGTSSAEGINTVTLTSATHGKHRLFFTYTDNSSSPDYAIFTHALTSFRLK